MFRLHPFKVWGMVGIEVWLLWDKVSTKGFLMIILVAKRLTV